MNVEREKINLSDVFKKDLLFTYDGIKSFRYLWDAKVFRTGILDLNDVIDFLQICAININCIPEKKYIYACYGWTELSKGNMFEEIGLDIFRDVMFVIHLPEIKELKAD